MRRDIQAEQAGRWGVFELAKKLQLPSVEVFGEMDVTSRIHGVQIERSDAVILSYHTDYVTFWIFLSIERGRYLPISAMIKDQNRERNPEQKLQYFSFVYRDDMSYRRIREIRRQRGLWISKIGPQENWLEPSLRL